MAKQKTPFVDRNVSVTVGPVDKEKLGAARNAAMERTAFGGGTGGVQTSFQNYGSRYSTMPLFPHMMFGSEDSTSAYIQNILMQDPRQRYQLYRHFYRNEPFVGQGIDLRSILPMSLVRFAKPGSGDKEFNKKVLASVERWADHVNLMKIMLSGQIERNLIGDCFIFAEWNEKKLWWEKLTILPPECVVVTPCQFSDKVVVEFIPDQDDVDLLKEMSRFGDGINDDDVEEERKRRLEDMPSEIKKMILNEERMFLGTDPMEGSFVYQISRNRSPYEANGMSLIERILTPLIVKEYLKNTQVGLASRNMTPKHIVSAAGASPEETDILREQIDASFLNPDYPIVTNFPVDYQLVGSQDRLLDLQREYEWAENQFIAGMGVTRELLIGESFFAGNRVTIEVVNTMFMHDREDWKEYTEGHLLKTMAIKRGWVEVKAVVFDMGKLDRSGLDKLPSEQRKVYPKSYTEIVEEPVYPRVRFNRITIRDHAEVFDSLFQLYQKGSLPLDYILDLLNIDIDDANEKLQESLFTPKDASFNEAMRDFYSGVGDQLMPAIGGQMARRIAESMGFMFGQKKEETKEEGEDDNSGGGGGKWGTAGRQRNGRSRDRVRKDNGVLVIGDKEVA